MAAFISFDVSLSLTGAAVAAFEVVALEGAELEYPAAIALPPTAMAAATVNANNLDVMSFSCTKPCFVMTLPRAG